MWIACWQNFESKLGNMIGMQLATSVDGAVFCEENNSGVTRNSDRNMNSCDARFQCVFTKFLIITGLNFPDCSAVGDN